MNIELEVLAEFKSIADSFPQRVRDNIEAAKVARTMRHKTEEGK